MQEHPDKPKTKQVEKMLPEMPPQETLQQKIDRFNQKFPDKRNLIATTIWNSEKKTWEQPYATKKPNEINESNTLNKIN